MLQMKIVKLIVIAIVLLLPAFSTQADEMKPFILGATLKGSVSEQIDTVKKKLIDNGFEISGEYSPYDTAYIIVVSNDVLKKMAASHQHAGYAAVSRISITNTAGQLQIAYTNPSYMAAAYRVEGNAELVTKKLKKALGFVMEYGAEEGLDEEDLAEYRYTLGMEKFDDVYELATYDSYEQALAAVEKGLAAHEGGATKVYRVDIPRKKQALFGVALSSRKTGNKYMDDEFIMKEIDFRDIRSTAHLPYEILVTGRKVEALHARFRIAINFPDLSMMGANSFMNIMPSPEAIKTSLIRVAGGEVEEDF
jgi:uncharacterized protein (DUF302 family)